MIISFQMIHISCLYLHFVKSYASARVRHDGPEFDDILDHHVSCQEHQGTHQDHHWTFKEAENLPYELPRR